MSEAYYDEHIAPELLRLGTLAQSNGISLLAVAEWSAGDYGTTINLVKGSSFNIRMVEAAIRSHGNVDILIRAIMKYAREHGHSSVILKELGVPVKP